MSSAIHSLTVALAERSYPIHIGPAVLSQHDLLTSSTGGKRPLIVTNDRVGPLYLERLQNALNEPAEVLQLPDGEQHKTLQTAERIYNALLDKGFNRDCCLIALGGGVIGDITGFAAATYQRGVAFIQVPTTLLSQVDASVGGKTAVNHPLGKNMIGAFHQPQAVLIDTNTLDTLPEREYLAGLAEIIKYGLLGDADFFDWIEQNLDGLLRKDDGLVTEAIRRSCENKATIVAADETERSGQRALLNLGHTFGHAIETAQGYGKWLHGEAVGVGMCMAADLSCRIGWLNPADRDRAIALIGRAGLPTLPPAGMVADDFIRNMQLDKKVASGQLRLILMQGIGKSILTSDYAETDLVATIRDYCEQSDRA